MTKLEQAAREVIRQHSMECLSDKTVDALREALAEQVHTPYCKQAPMCKTPCGNSDCVEQAEQEPVCKRCNGTKIVPDGKMYSVDGFQLEVPIECVKDCPDCTAPVRTKDLTDEIDRLCAAIKAEDDYCVDNGNYMLDSNDCIKIIRGEWVRPDYSLDRAVIAADREKNK